VIFLEVKQERDYMSQQLLNSLWEGIQEEGQVMVGLRENQNHSEPMHAYLDKNADDRLWLIMKKDNRVAKGGESIVQYIGKDHKLFASIAGELVEEEDQSMLDMFWSNAAEAWFDEGIDDPNLHFMRLDLKSVEIWNKNPTFTGALKMSTGSKVDPEDAGDHTLVEFKKRAQ
jgi:general stress protein 26